MEELRKRRSCLFEVLNGSPLFILWPQFEKLQISEWPQEVLRQAKDTVIPSILCCTDEERSDTYLYGLVSMLYNSVLDGEAGGNFSVLAKENFSQLFMELSRILSENDLVISPLKTISRIYSILPEIWCETSDEDVADKILDYIISLLKANDDPDYWSKITNTIREHDRNCPTNRIVKAYTRFCLEEKSFSDFVCFQRLLWTLSIGWVRKQGSHRLCFLMNKNEDVDPDQIRSLLDELGFAMPEGQ